MNRSPIVLLFPLFITLGCANQAQPIESKPEERDSLVAAPEGNDDGDAWAYIAIPNDRDRPELTPVTGSSHDPEEMPAAKTDDPETRPVRQKEQERVRIKKCGVDPDCPKPRVCLRPTGGPHPFGVCGEAVDGIGRPTPNRTVRSCGVHLSCPSGTRCVLAYGDYGMCFK